MVPELEEKMVVCIERQANGFALRLDDGEEFKVRRVVLAVGITHFEHLPQNLAHLPAEFLSHSYRHHDLAAFKGRNVVVLGGGSSALDMAGLLRDGDADVQLVARATELKFHTGPKAGKRRSWWQRLRHPDSGLGPGMKSRFFSDGAALFHYLPQSMRVDIVRTTLGPSGGWFIREKVMGRVPLVLGHTVETADVVDRKVRLNLRGLDGSKREIVTEHVIAATGYKVDMERLKFLNPEIRSKTQVRQRHTGAFVEFRILRSRPLFRRDCRRQQLRTGDALRVRRWFRCETPDAAPWRNHSNGILRLFGRLQRCDDRGMSDPARLVLRYCCLNRIPAAARHGFFNPCF